MAERGPLPQLVTRRRNKKPAAGKSILVARPVMPASLKPEAKAEWRRVVGELEQMGLLAKMDRGLLIRYCTVWADWVEVNDLLQRSTKLVRGQQNTLVRNPLWMMRSDADATLADLARQLGIGPMARLRAGVTHEQPEPEEDDEAITALDEYRSRLARY